MQQHKTIQLSEHFLFTIICMAAKGPPKPQLDQTYH